MFDNLSDKLQNVFSGFRSKGKLTEEDIDAGIKEIRMALLEADVNFKVVKKFCRQVKERCMTADVMDSLTPGQNVVKIVLEEMQALLGGETTELHLGSRIPSVIMLVGLQGSGKTTAASKLAYRLKKKGHVPLLAACDVYRPAAADQLQTLGDEQGVRVFRGDGKHPVEIAKGAVQDAIDNMRDVVIVDTAGRLHVDHDGRGGRDPRCRQTRSDLHGRRCHDRPRRRQRRLRVCAPGRFRRRHHDQDGRRRPWRRCAVHPRGYR